MFRDKISKIKMRHICIRETKIKHIYVVAGAYMKDIYAVAGAYMKDTYVVARAYMKHMYVVAGGVRHV